MTVEKYTLRELEKLIKEGGKYKLFKPFIYKGQVLINLEKILTTKDLFKLDGKVFGSIDVLHTVEHNTDDKLRKAVIENAIKILKTSKTFRVDEISHLDFTKRKAVEKLINGIIGNSPMLAQIMLKIHNHSKKLFMHSIKVAIISTVIDLGIQEKNKHEDGLRSEILLTGALLHDVGFLKLPLSFLDKRRVEYSEDERKVYTDYPIEGERIASDFNNAFRKDSIKIIAQHQERLPGNGFPIGTNGDAIYELALIVGLADEFDLLLSNEISTSLKKPSEIMSRISRSGKIFGTHIVDSFYTWFRYLK